MTEESLVGNNFLFCCKRSMILNTASLDEKIGNPVAKKEVEAHFGFKVIIFVSCYFELSVRPPF